MKKLSKEDLEKKRKYHQKRAYYYEAKIDKLNEQSKRIIGFKRYD